MSKGKETGPSLWFRPGEQKVIGTVVQVLLPSIKMKSHSKRGVPFEREFHKFLINQFGGYTAASGNITGYWIRSRGREECNEHREYQIALSSKEDLTLLTDHLSVLAGALKEQTIFCTMNGIAFLVSASKAKRRHP